MVGGGGMRAGSTRAFGLNSAVTLSNLAGVSLDLNGFNNSVGSLAGGGTTGGGITLGAGTLTITGANSYDGPTTISAGSLNVQHSPGLRTTAGRTAPTPGPDLPTQRGLPVSPGPPTPH